jgi:hypothetical protein
LALNEDVPTPPLDPRMAIVVGRIERSYQPPDHRATKAAIGSVFGVDGGRKRERVEARTSMFARPFLADGVGLAHRIR